MKNRADKTATLKHRCATGEIALGAWCMMSDPLAVEVVCNAPFDWIAIDMQHGCISYESALSMIRSADISAVPSVVRVPWNEPGIIGKVLDAGAMGIIVPMIEDTDDVQEMLNACYYPPLGQRSFGPVRVSQRDGMSYGSDANERVMVLPMIETAKALECVHDILAMEGVDGVFVGPFDLSISLGLMPGDNDGDPVFDAAIERVMRACEKAGKFAAVLSNVPVAPTRIGQGFKLVSVTTDFSTLGQASAECLTTVKNKIQE